MKAFDIGHEFDMINNQINLILHQLDLRKIHWLVDQNAAVFNLFTYVLHQDAAWHVQLHQEDLCHLPQPASLPPVHLSPIAFASASS